MNESLSAIQEQYASSLLEYLRTGGEAARAQAYEIGRQALNQGLGILEMASIHHQAVQAARQRSSGNGRHDEAAERTEAFFLECLSPFEIAQRSFRESNAALRSLNVAFEKEARRIALALHDDAGPLLVSAHIALENLVRDLPPECHGRLAEIRERLNQIEDQLRSMSHELRPTLLDLFGLVPALRSLAEGVSSRAGVRIDLENVPEERLPPAVETTLYRVVQEALLNVSRHARATNARVHFAREGPRIHCSIADDGTGFQPPSGSGPGASGGLGLIGIRERLGTIGGTLQIVSAPGRGTELHVTIPLEA